MHQLFKQAGLTLPKVERYDIKGVEVHALRLDKIHPYISGNKIYKLMLNIEQALSVGKPILTFGGAYSNHILATAALCHKLNLPCVGVIRGEELQDKWQANQTLSLAQQWGMELRFISRSDYRAYTQQGKTIAAPDKHYMIPEGGKNSLGVLGCSHILDHIETDRYDAIFVSMGTGGTAEGMAMAQLDAPIYAVDVLKGIDRLACKGMKPLAGYHYGGYGKFHQENVAYIQTMWKIYALPLDPIYTVKSFRAMMDYKQANPAHHVLWIHSGGIQANAGFNQKYNCTLPEISEVYE